MNTESFEQISLNKNILDSPGLLKEGENVMVSINTETDLPLLVDMPASVILEVTYAESQVLKILQRMQLNWQLLKRERLSMFYSSMKGDKIKIDTASGSYMERVKNK
jgi:elongation factor P